MADSSYSPMDAEEGLDDELSADSPTDLVRTSCAMQEYGPRPLASLLDYFYEDVSRSRMRMIKKSAELVFLSVLLLIILPHTFVSFIFMYSTGQPVPLWLLLAPLVLYRKQSSSKLAGFIIFMFAFWPYFGILSSMFTFMFGDEWNDNFPRFMWLCLPLQVKLYSAALTFTLSVAVLIVLLFSVRQVPRDDAATLQRNWHLARAGALVIAIVFLFMCSLDAARMGHPFSNTAVAVFNVSAMSVATNIQSFAALSACVISSEGRLSCSNNEFRHDRGGIVGVFDVNGLHGFSEANFEYGFGLQFLNPSVDSHFSRVEHVSVGGTHVCVVATGFFRAERQMWGKLWYLPWFMRDQFMWTRRNDSVVACWGYNDHGQLGTGAATSENDRKYGTLREYTETPVEVTLLSPFPTNERGLEPSLLLPRDRVVHLVAGHCHSCALTLLGSLFCWGCNTFGQVGSPMHCPNKKSCNSPAAVSLSHLNTTLPISIAAAADNTCAVVGPLHVVVCWGRNNQAQLGRSAELSDPLAPVGQNSAGSHSEYPWFVDGLPDGAIRLAVGREHACALFTDGMLRCWGSNRWGQLGGAACGTDNMCRKPVIVHVGSRSTSALQVPSSFCAGNRITCGIFDSRLRCFGAIANQTMSNRSLAFNESLPQDFHVSDNAVSIVCSVNDRSPRFGLIRPRPEARELDEYSVSVSKYAVKSMGLVEGVCVRNSSGHISCIEGQFCDEYGEMCSNGSIFTASVSRNERIIVDFETGIFFFLWYTWHLLFYYRYILLTILKWLFPSQRYADKGLVCAEDIPLIEMEQYWDCAAQVESLGFCPEAARQASAATGGDLQAAVAWLAEHPGAPYDNVLHFLGLSVIEKIGQGGFGSVYRCSSALERGKPIAVKVLSFAVNSKDAQHATREGQRLADCSHENIVRMYKVHQPPNFPGIFVFEMEFVSGGDLSQHLTRRLPHPCVLRFTRQLLNAMIYLHDTKQLLHGDIKPQNILVEGITPSVDDFPVDYSRSVLKLADFGLAKSFAPAASNDSTTRAGAGTEWYMSSEALKGNQRCFADDIWSLCLVILEMDTGMPLQQLMQGPGAVKINELLLKASPQLLPVLYPVLSGHVSSRCLNARDLLRHLDLCVEAIFEWQVFDGSQFVALCAAASFVLENAFIAGASSATLQLPPPLDLVFDIKLVCEKADGLGTQTHALSGDHPRPIRRMLRPHVLSNCLDIPVWQQLICGKDWKQYSPQLCAKLESEYRRMGRVNVAAVSRRIVIQRNMLGSVMIPFPLHREPYCVTLVPPTGAGTQPSLSALDFDSLSARVHESLPEFDITNLEAVVNQTLDSKYSGYRQRIAMRCNGDPNERFLFHFCPEPVIPKIWQEGEGHDPRLSQWAEVGKGAYFSEHVIYGYAYRFNLWEGGTEPSIGETFRVFVTLVALGNCKDLQGGCGTCTSPEWEEWKREFAPMRIENPTRPPEFALPLDAGERKHRLDLMGVKDKPRYDSVTSTEGDLGTSSASTYMNKAKTHLVRDVMHPRLLLRSHEWGRQYVVFDTAASYPMYILTLSKKRDSPKL